MLIGKKLGRYEIRQQIGSGGMGEIYLAHDEQLNRSVALKILSGEFSDDELRRNRFRQEARAVSALNHPNIITIYEIGDNEYGSFLATEFINGKTLREIIRKTPLSISRAVKVAEQVANALVAAHAAGIVHRDIKPENVMVREDGYVKVLDFGLAKPVIQNANGDGEPDTVKTTPGMVVGSVRYMSPEQARGLAVDERTDVWSLGVCLYESLAGHAPFDGDTTSDTLAAVIYREPESIVHFVPNAPAELQRILRRALNKDRDERYQSIKDFALDLKNLLYDIEHEISAENKTQTLPAFFIDNTSAPNRIHQTSGASRRTHISTIPTVSSAEYVVHQIRTHKWQTALLSIGAIALLAAMSFGFYRWMLARPAALKTRAAFEKTQISRISTDGKVLLPAISPDGKYIAYLGGDIGSRTLVVRQVATDSTVTIGQPTPFTFRGINFTPDGNYIYYVQLTGDNSLGTLYQVPTLGGTPKKLIEDVDSGVSFSPDGKRLAFIRHVPKDNNDIVFTANSDGSNVQPLIGSKDTEFNFFQRVNPQWSPDGTKILVTGGKMEGGEADGMQLAEIAVANGKFNVFNGKKWKHIVDYVWVKDGSAILLTAKNAEEGTTQVWRFGYPNGELHAVTNDLNNYFRLGLSADSASLITIKNDVVSNLWTFSPQTKELTQISSESRGADGEAGLVETNDGKLLFTRHDETKINLWTIGMDGKSAAQRVTDEAKFNGYPVVSPDGRFIVFCSNRTGGARIWRMDADGKNAKPLTDENANTGDYEPQFMPDGKTVVFLRDSKSDGKPALFKISIEGGTPTPILTDENVTMMYPRLSPDGKRLAFVKFDDATFKKSLRVAAFDGERVGAIEREFDYNLMGTFMWSPDGKSLTYMSVESIPNLWRLPLDGTKPQPVTDFKSGRIFNYAWSRDGKRLYLVRGIVNNDLVLIRDVKS